MAGHVPAAVAWRVIPSPHTDTIRKPVASRGRVHLHATSAVLHLTRSGVDLLRCRDAPEGCTGGPLMPHRYRGHSSGLKMLSRGSTILPQTCCRQMRIRGQH